MIVVVVDAFAPSVGSLRVNLRVYRVTSFEDFAQNLLAKKAEKSGHSNLRTGNSHGAETFDGQGHSSVTGTWG